jgi:hypothetical protein
MRTQGEIRTAEGWPQPEVIVPGVRRDLGQVSRLPGSPASREDGKDAAASSSPREGTRAEPCPVRIWWFGVLVGGPLTLIGFLLTLTLFGAPLGIPLWAAGLGLMLSPRPCRE